MPTISSFFGIVVTMYWREHEPAHFHARYGEFEAIVGIETLGVLRGTMPRRALALVLEWAAEHSDELMEDGAFAARIRRQTRFDRWSNADDSLESDEIESPSRPQAASDFCRWVVRHRGPVEGQVRRNPGTTGGRYLLRTGAARGRRGHLAERRRDRPRRDVRRSPRQPARLCLRSGATRPPSETQAPRPKPLYSARQGFRSALSG